MKTKSFKLLNKIRDSHKWCCVNIYSDYNYIWEVTLVRAGSCDHSKPQIRVSDDDIDRAILKAYDESEAFLRAETSGE